LRDFCLQKGLYQQLINKILLKCTWSSLFTEDEEIMFYEIENWLIEKQLERADREIFDVNELVLKFDNYVDKKIILNTIMTKTIIERKKIKALIKDSNSFEDLTDDHFEVLKLIKGFFDDNHVIQNSINTWAGVAKECPISRNQSNVLENVNKSLEFFCSTHYHHQKPINLESKKRKMGKPLQPHFNLENCASILDKVNEEVYRVKDQQKVNPVKIRKTDNNNGLDECNQPTTSYQANKQFNKLLQKISFCNQKL
jgi:hypothetical protein